jgi:hypothetical protein
LFVWVYKLILELYKVGVIVWKSNKTVTEDMSNVFTVATHYKDERKAELGQ